MTANNRVDLPQDRCECLAPSVVEGSGMCQVCLGNIGVTDIDALIKGHLDSEVCYSTENNNQGICTKGELEYIRVLDGV